MKLWFFFILPISFILCFNFLYLNINSYNFLSTESLQSILNTFKIYAFQSTVESVEVLNEKANTLFDSGKYEEAIEYYDKIIEIEPNNADAEVNKGLALNELVNKGVYLSYFGQPKEAITYYDKALAIDGNYTDALNNKAFALANLDRNEEALPIIEQVLESNSDNEAYLATAAFIMHNLGKDDESRNYFNKALDINPNLKDILSKAELDVFNLVMK